MFIEAILRGCPPPSAPTIISWAAADDLRGTGIGLFLINAAVLCRRPSDSVRDAVMDALKKVTRLPVQVFHTAHIVLDRDGSSDVTSGDIKSFFSGGWLHFPAVFFLCALLFLLIPSENSVRQGRVPSRCISLKHLEGKGPFMSDAECGSALCPSHIQPRVIIGQTSRLLLPFVCLGSLSHDSQYPPDRSSLHQDFFLLPKKESLKSCRSDRNKS